MIECLYSMHKALGSILSTTKERLKEKEKKKKKIKNCIDVG